MDVSAWPVENAPDRVVLTHNPPCMIRLDRSYFLDSAHRAAIVPIRVR